MKTEINNKIPKYELLEFRKIHLDDSYDELYNDNSAWSRLYEYKMVFDWLEKLVDKNSLIHNTSWGFEGVHILFKNKLDSHFPNVIHSDIRKSEFSNTFIYDITKTPEESECNKYDVVVNISTLEEVNFNQIKIINNLFKQVKVGGYLVITFDIIDNYKGNGSMDVNALENNLGLKIKQFSNNLNGSNSKLPNQRYSYLNCGILVVKKTT